MKAWRAGPMNEKPAPCTTPATISIQYSTMPRAIIVASQALFAATISWQTMST